MSNQITTIFNVLDNLFGHPHHPTNVERWNREQILELRHQVLHFYKSYRIKQASGSMTRLYLGGFLSSPPFIVETSPYISSALLCSDSLVLFDPLHHWFCDEQYQRRRLQSAPSGWRDSENGKPDFIRTKHYLAHAFRWLYSIRPLVEAGIIVLIPAEQIIFSSSSDIQQFVSGIVDVAKPIEELAKKFPPKHITIDDNRKGLFAFLGGDPGVQIRHSILRGIEQFARDVVIANNTGAIYTAPFPWEQHLGKTAFNDFTPPQQQAMVVEGVRTLRLPMLAKLTPDILVRIHQDSGYTTFRAGIRDALRNINAEIGSQDFQHRVAEIERDVLLPKVEALHQEVRSSNFSKATNATYDGVMTFVQNFAGGLLTGSSVERSLYAGGATGLIGFVAAMLKRRKDTTDRRIWIQLLPKNTSLPTYGSPLTLKQIPGVVRGWQIPAHPSNNVIVSPGVLKFPWEAFGES